MKPRPSEAGSLDDTSIPLIEWRARLDAWCADIDRNTHYQERAYCYFEQTSKGSVLKFDIALHPSPAEQPPAQEQTTAVQPAIPPAEQVRKADIGVHVVNARPALAKLLPTRAEAQGRIVVRKPSPQTVPPQASGSQGARSSTVQHPPGSQRSSSVPSVDVQTRSETEDIRASDTKTLKSNSLSAINNVGVMDRPLLIAARSALNQDLASVVVQSAPGVLERADLVRPSLLQNDALINEADLQTVAGRYGIVLRAALMAKVTGSKANVGLLINRLENLREIFTQADHLSASRMHKAQIMRALWQMLDDLHGTEAVTAADVKGHVQSIRTLIDTPLHSGLSGLFSRVAAVAWYQWHVRLPLWVSAHIDLLSRIGHALAAGAFAALLVFCVHPALSPWDGTLANLLALFEQWRSQWPVDAATLAVLLAGGAASMFALTTQRLTLPERVALEINDKIETVLDSTLADLMKANMDVQIGRLGRAEPPAIMPEALARRLDDIFALKELVNSYESTVRARRRHVADEVNKAQGIRRESYQRLRNAALGVTASFVLLEIGSRIQSHRDLQYGTDAQSYAYWLLGRSGVQDSASVQVAERVNPAILEYPDGQDGTFVQGVQHKAAGVLSPPVVSGSGLGVGGPESTGLGVTGSGVLNAPKETLDCARTEIAQQQPPSPECLDAWRDSALASSSQLLFLVFLIAMLMFVVRVMRRSSEPDNA